MMTDLRRSVILGGALGATCTAVYATSIDLPYDPDGATTVGWYLQEPGISQIFRRNIAYSNHVLFTFLSKLVHLAVGEGWPLHVLPILAAGVAVGVLSCAVARYHGVVAGTVAGVVLATNPLFAHEAKTIRGYSLLVLFAVASSVLLPRMRAAETPSRADRLAYVLLASGGIAAHLYMIPLVLLQAVYVLVRRRPSWQWFLTFAAAGALGLAVYVHMIRTLIADKGLGSLFRPTFPIDLAYDFLGGTPVAILIFGVLLCLHVLGTDQRREWTLVGGCFLSGVAFIWLVLHPLNPGSRFFLWGIPAVALAVGAVAGRSRLAVAGVVVAVVSQIVAQVDTWRYVDFAQAQAGPAVQRDADAGFRVCSVGYGDGPLSAYTEPGTFRSVLGQAPLSELRGCDRIVVITRQNISREMAATLDSLPVLARFHADREDAVIYAPVP